MPSHAKACAILPPDENSIRARFVLVDNPRLVNHYLTAVAPGGIGLGVTVNTVKAGVNNCVLKKTAQDPALKIDHSQSLEAD